MEEIITSMTPCYNPSLREMPRSQSITAVPPIMQETLLDWLENSGRFLARDLDELQERKVVEELDDFLDPEIYAPEEEEQQDDD